jgi:uncharacterized protein DUF4382
MSFRLGTPVRRPSLALLSALAAVLGLGCSEHGRGVTQTGQGGSTHVLLTDDPFPYERLARVDLYIVSVAASLTADTGLLGDSTGSNFVTLARPARRFDILALQGGATAELGSVDLPPGAYKAVRLVIDTDSSSMTLKDGRVLSGATTPGIDWQSSAGRPTLFALVHEQLEVVDTGAVIVIAFDVGNSFWPADSSFIFMPVLHAVDAARTGAITGSVRAAGAGGTPVADATVTAYVGIPAYPENTWAALATGRTDSVGAFRIAYLTRSAWWATTGWGPAATYIVAVDPPSGSGLGRVLVPNVTVVAGGTTAMGTVVLP